MKVQYYTATTLDGFIASTDHSLDWLYQFDDNGLDDYPAFIAEVGAIIMGSHTYEWLLRHEVMPPEGLPKPWPYNQPVWVMTSRDLPRVTGDIRFRQGDIRPVYDEMVAAAPGKNIWVVGGGELVGQFFDHGLLDELIVTIASATLGHGMPLLPRRISHPPLALRSVKQIGTGFVTLRYDVPKR